MYVYYIRWTILGEGENKISGNCEHRTDEPITSMEDILEIESYILDFVYENSLLQTSPLFEEYSKEDFVVLVDFYSLLRKEE